MTSSKVALALVLAGCADVERGPAALVSDAAPAGGGSAGDGGGASFAAVRPILRSGCASCHAAGQMAGNTGFLLGDDAAADYRSTRAFVDPADPAGSRLVVKAAGQGHQGGTVWRPGLPEHTALVAWIAGGAAP